MLLITQTLKANNMCMSSLFSRNTYHRPWLQSSQKRKLNFVQRGRFLTLWSPDARHSMFLCVIISISKWAQISSFYRRKTKGQIKWVGQGLLTMIYHVNFGMLLYWLIYSCFPLKDLWASQLYRWRHWGWNKNCLLFLTVSEVIFCDFTFIYQKRAAVIHWSHPSDIALFLP